MALPNALAEWLCRSVVMPPNKTKKASPNPRSPIDCFGEVCCQVYEDSAPATKDRLSLQNNRFPKDIKRPIFRASHVGERDERSAPALTHSRRVCLWK
jgi:hypothetical protein